MDAVGIVSKIELSKIYAGIIALSAYVTQVPWPDGSTQDCVRYSLGALVVALMGWKTPSADRTEKVANKTITLTQALNRINKEPVSIKAKLMGKLGGIDGKSL